MPLPPPHLKEPLNHKLIALSRVIEYLDNDILYKIIEKTDLKEDEHLLEQHVTTYNTKFEGTGKKLFIKNDGRPDILAFLVNYISILSKKTPEGIRELGKKKKKKKKKKSNKGKNKNQRRNQRKNQRTKKR